MSSNIHIHIHDVRWKSRLRPYAKTIRDACALLLKKEERELTIVLADDNFIRDLNAQYRGKNKPTNVLAFEGDDDYLGDVVLSFETIAAEAKEQNKSFKNHSTHMIIHGVLHLLGYEHETDKDAKVMENLEIKILKKLNISNPYLS